MAEHKTSLPAALVGNPFEAALSLALQKLRDDPFALHAACRKKAITAETVSALIAAKASVDACDESQCTPLGLASFCGNEAVAKVLVSAGADVPTCIQGGDYDFEDGFALWTACRNRHRFIASVLIRARADVNESVIGEGAPIHLACREGWKDVVMLLIEAQADVNMEHDQEVPESSQCGTQPLQSACLNNHSDIVEILVESRANINLTSRSWGCSIPLHYACEQRNERLVQQLLSARADINAMDFEDGETALSIAARQNDLVLTRLFLKAGASMYAESHFDLEYDEESFDEEVEDQDGSETEQEEPQSAYTLPLFVACQLGLDNVVEILLEAKIDVNIPTTRGKWTPLFTVEKKECTRAVELILAAKADVNHRASDGATPLHKAALLKEPSAALLMIQKNADLNARMRGGKTPLMSACERANEKVVGLLLGAGASACQLDVHGDDALTMAFKRGHKGIAKTLLEYGASFEILARKVKRTSLSQMTLCAEAADKHRLALFQMMSTDHYLISEIWDIVQSFTNQYNPEWRQIVRANTDVSAKSKT